MANELTRVGRECMIELEKLDIPYDSVGFTKWLTGSAKLSVKNANKQIQYIRDADIELWEPGDPELTTNIAKYMVEAKNAKNETIKTLYYDFIFIDLISEVEYLQNLMSCVEDESKPFLKSVIKAYKYYNAFMMESLNYSQSQLEELLIDTESDGDAKSYVHQNQSRYDPVPLERDFKDYLSEYHFSSSTRYKMLSYLRKLNALVINNGRGDSDWLQKLADKAQNGVNVRYARVQAHNVVHEVIKNIDDSDEITISELRGGLTAINYYLNFLVNISKRRIN